MSSKTTRLFRDARVMVGPASLTGVAARLADIDTMGTALLTGCVVAACGLYLYRSVVNQWISSAYALIAICVGIAAYGLTYQSPLLRSTGLIGYYQPSNSFLPQLRPRIRAAAQELLFVGTHFYITAEDCHDDLLDRLSHGVNIKILILDPKSPRIDLIAKDFSVETQNLLTECFAGLEDLMRLQSDWQKIQPEAVNPGTLEIRAFDLCPKMRAYAFDANTPKGEVYLVPYGNMLNSPQTPGYLFRISKGGAAENYVVGFRKLWLESKPLETSVPETSTEKSPN